MYFAYVFEDEDLFFSLKVIIVGIESNLVGALETGSTVILIQSLCSYNGSWR